MTGNTGISNFQHLRFRKCSQSRNHVFSGMIQFHFFWAHSFVSDDRAQSVGMLTVRNAVSWWKRVITRVYIVSKDHRKVGTKREQDTENHVFLVFHSFSHKSSKRQKNNGKIGTVIMNMRFCYIRKTTQNINVSSAKKNCYFQPYFLFSALQFNVCRESGYSPM